MKTTDTFSPEAKAVWERLDRETREIIQRDYPFKRDRDEAIYELRQRGVEIKVLAEISGMNFNNVRRIEKKLKKDRQFDIRHNLSRIRKSFEGFYNTCAYYIGNGKK